MRTFRLLRLGLLGCALVAAVPAAAHAAPPWRWPLEGAPLVMRPFDPPPLPWAAGHRGVDLRAREGDAVLAAGAGVVGFAGTLAGRGVVAVHHAGGLETTYEPLHVLVRAGQRVRLGQVLGRVVAGHGSCGVGFVCLHWGLRRGDSYLDPLSLVRGGPIRLLPVWSGDRANGVTLPVAGADGPDRSRHPATQPGRETSVALAGAATTGVGLGAIAVGASRRRRRLNGRVAARS